MCASINRECGIINCYIIHRSSFHSVFLECQEKNLETKENALLHRKCYAARIMLSVSENQHNEVKLCIGFPWKQSSCISDGLWQVWNETLLWKNKNKKSCLFIVVIGKLPSGQIALILEIMNIWKDIICFLKVRFQLTMAEHLHWCCHIITPN